MAEYQEESKARGTSKKAATGKKATFQGAAPTESSSKKTAPRAAAKKAAAQKKPAARRTTGKSAGAVSAEERYRMIQEAAYLRAEREGFHCDPYQCWLSAEAEVDARLASSR